MPHAKFLQEILGKTMKQAQFFLDIIIEFSTYFALIAGILVRLIVTANMYDVVVPLCTCGEALKTDVKSCPISSKCYHLGLGIPSRSKGCF